MAHDAYETCFSENFQATHMQKSVITISDDGSLVVQKRMFSGLFTSHGLDPKISPKIGRVNDNEVGQHT